MDRIHRSPEELERLLLGSPEPVLIRVRRGSTEADSALDELAREFGQTVRMITIDADEIPSLAGSLRLDPIPDLLFLRRGQIFDRFCGTLPKRLVAARLRAMLEAA